MPKEVQQYIDAVEDKRRSLLLRFQSLILRLYPNVEIKISYQIPCYKTNTGWIFLGYWKNGVSIYTGIFPMLDEFKEKHPKIKTGKGSINFKITDEIPWQDVEAIVKFSMERKLVV